jgi:hypothetical protein
LCYLVKASGRDPDQGGEARVGGDQARGEDDHDLLTFGESAARLREEIALTEAALREDPAPERRAALSARLGALNDALRRNARHAGATPGETGFLGYRPRDPG